MSEEVKLTEEQKKKIPEYVDKWIKASEEITPTNKELAEELITKIYNKMNLNKPKFFWFKSPASCCKFISEENGEDYVFDSSFLSNPNDVGWLSFHDFLKNETKEKIDENKEEMFQIFSKLTKACFWWWSFEQEVVVSENPISMGVIKNAQGNWVLHNEHGPAFAFDDDYQDKIYSLNGVKIPAEIVETPAEQLDPNLILKQTHAEIRPEIVRKIGVERIMIKLGAQTIDEWKEIYEMLKLDFKGRDSWYYLKMKNPSVPGVFHLEGISPQLVSKFKQGHKKGELCQAALAWRNGQDDEFEYVEPEQLT